MLNDAPPFTYVTFTVNEVPEYDVINPSMYWLGTDVAYTLTYWPTANAVTLASKLVVNDLLPSPIELEPVAVNPEYPNPE